MKMLFVCASAIGFLVRASAADPDALKFGGERIGIPPLSLRENLPSGLTPPLFRSRLPSYSDETESSKLAPKFLPRTVPDVMRKSMPRNPRSPQVSRHHGMPVITPSDAVDYAMTIVPPDPKIDFKIVVKEPAYPAKTQPEAAK
jgi:hypothetical protein